MSSIEIRWLTKTFGSVPVVKGIDLTIAAAAVLLVGITAILIIILERLVGFDRLIGQGIFR